MKLFCAVFIVFFCLANISWAGDDAEQSALNSSSDDELILDDAENIVPADSAPLKPEAVEPIVKPTTPKPSDSAVLAPRLGEPKAIEPSSVTAPQPVSTKKPSVDTLKNIIDEELILEGGEEDLLTQDKSLIAREKNTKVITPIDTAASGAAGSIIPQPDSLKPVNLINQESSEIADSVPSKADSLEKPAINAPVVIEKVKAINFARNVKDYRSPKLAMLFSLLLPGAGQIYARSNAWAVGFLAAEAAIITTGVVYSAKSKDKKKEARDFADNHYDLDKFQGYTGDLRDYLAIQSGSRARGDTIYRDSIFHYDSSDIQFVANARLKNNDFYTSLESTAEAYIQGWDDVVPPFTRQEGFGNRDTLLYGVVAGKPYLVYQKGDIQTASFGFSLNQSRYNSILDESKKLANYSRNVFLILVVNHIASAVSAGLEAKSHNDRLLGRESFWQRFELREQLVNTGTETVHGYALKIGF